MADITVTEVNVKKGSAARILTGAVAEAIGVGALVIINRTDANRLYLSDSDEPTDTYRQGITGISLSKSVGADQVITYQADDKVDFGAGVLEQGMIYVSSPNRGKICPYTDIAKFSVKTSQITSNVATLTTNIPHGFIVGQTVTVSGVGSPYNGAFVVTVVGSTTTFSYALTNTNDGPNSVTGSSQVRGIAVNIIGIAEDTQFLKLLINGVNGNTGIAR